MNNFRSVRRSPVLTVLVAAVLPALLPALLFDVSSALQSGLAQPSAVLAGDDTKTGGGPG
ncbi:hypothetical protein GCM10010841_32580 [Deinococcus aerophilus]|uniref:Uncharacterized protein n=1 Tax=Deinococcus aerophilus TaxID=522488 RepID=A0ABQ2GZV7_9DEIO|nr:hypothetical protein GCM10010841_32580 [Deinococcus aerophilus]